MSDSSAPRIRMAMVGGCPGKFICDVHHYAWRLDGLIELVAGAFSPDAERNRRAGEALHLDPARVYGDWRELIAREAERPAAERPQLVASITPNQLHAPVAIAALEAGFAVISDKPLAFSLAEGRELAAVVERTGLPFALTHTYALYPMIHEARALVHGGELGAVRKVVVEYLQGGAGMALTSGDERRLAGARDPGHQTDRSGCFSDIGVHAAQLTEFVTGRSIERVAARTESWIPGRTLDADCDVLLALAGGGTGVLTTSQVCVGNENPLALRVWCERGAIEWRQEEPNSMLLRPIDGPMQVRRVGRFAGDAMRSATRLPAAHPEGYIEAFANFYARIARQLQARAADREPDPADLVLPGIADGLRGMAITEAVIDSAERDSAWTAVSG